MPLEPLPLDRKEFVFRDRKHERGQSFDAVASSGGGGGAFTPRWRDPYRRTPTSYHRQSVSYHQFYGESPTRSVGGSGDRFWLEDERRYGGGRSRGSFRRSPYYDSVPPHATSQRSVAVPIHSPPPLKDPVNDRQGVNDQRSDRDRENSLGSTRWKPLKWSRQGSVGSSRTSTGRPEAAAEEVGTEARQPGSGKEAPVRSPVDSPLQAEDELPKKKPRLGWGQGLAKYEKQKVEGSSNSGKDQASETSPKITGMAGSVSPVTPCSAACSFSSAGVDGMPFTKAASLENDTFHTRGSPGSGSGSKSYPEELSINTDNLPPISTLTSLLNDLLQSEDAFSGDSTFTRNAAMNKLLLFKADIAKELEITECEVDLFENELKSLNTDGRSVPCQSSCVGLSEGSVKMSLNFAPGLSSEMQGIEGPIMQNCSSNEHDAYVKNADCSIPHLLISNIAQSGSENEISGTVTVNSVGHDVNFENTPEAQQSNPDKVERVVNRNVFRDERKLDASGRGATYLEDGSSHARASDNNLISLVMASNRAAAERASHVFDKTAPTIPQDFDMWGSDQISSCRKNDMHVKEKLALHKCQEKFKERVLALKFRAFHHLWKEDLRLLSVRKQRPKSQQKRYEIQNRSSQSGSQKNRSSIRSRFALPAGNLTLVPTADIIYFTSKLLSDSDTKRLRSNLKMPALILDEKERRCSRFITKNSLVEDPLSLEKERTLINPWSEEEKGVFTEMLATYGKDFAKISSFLTHKNTADCIEFYYKNHKSESFRDVKKQLDSRKQWRCLPTNTYLVTTGKKWNREANAASLDLLGSVSVTAANENGHTRNQHKYARRTVLPSYHGPHASYGSLERVKSVEISGLDMETTAADVLAGICGTLSSEAMSSCVTSSVSPPEKMHCLMMDQPLTPDTQFVEEEDTCSDEGCGELLDSVDWTDEEKSIFIRALSMCGKDFAKISHCVGTKSRDQCKIFFSKARKCLGLDMIQPAAGDVETPISYANGGRSDTDDACAAELDSAICSTQSCSKTDVDFTQSVVHASCEGFVNAGHSSLQTETDRSSEQYELRGSNKEELEDKADGLESTLNIDKLEAEVGDLHSAKTPEETAENAFGSDYVGLAGDSGSMKVANDCVGSPVEQIACTKGKQLSACNEGEQLKPQLAANIQQNATTIGRSPSDVVKSGVDLQQQVRLLSETGSSDRQQEKIDMVQCNSVNLPFTYSDVNTAGDASYKENSQIMSLKQDNIHSVSSSTMLPGPSSIYSEGSLRVTSPCTLSFEGHANRLQQASASRDFYQQSMLGNQSVNQSDHVLSGYPLQVSQKELEKDTNQKSDKAIMIAKGGASTRLARYFVPDINNEKCNGSAVSNSGPVMLFPPLSEDQSLRSSSRNACQDSEEQSNHVKLFGQILSNPSRLQKSNSSPLESEGQVYWPKLKKSATMKSNISRTDNDPMFSSRPRSSGQAGQQDVPQRSYGFWDGNMIQTGFSSLPESVLMYPSSIGMPINSTKDNSVPSTSGYQQAQVQPLSANGKRLPELKRNGFEDSRQQGRTAVARLGVNMAGGSRSIVVGGAGVSDPVAATARAAMEPWRTTDLGGR
ncbi:uncharacterized protein M6B38_103690 [Iris pallida]|uniref:SANT domain-containing protein n=1 Tax=Iris pallida TaxID=29817 RepID=A0AAX6F325_IRIPA|nr:uncharacterized protein M6B38_103690 [Iris pallida]